MTFCSYNAWLSYLIFCVDVGKLLKLFPMQFHHFKFKMVITPTTRWDFKDHVFEEGEEEKEEEENNNGSDDKVNNNRDGGDEEENKNDNNEEDSEEDEKPSLLNF